MRPYETLVVLSNTLGADMPSLLDRLREVIRSNGGLVEESHDWGNRKLAYPIKKQTDGHYFLLEYSAEPKAVSELERTLRIADGVLRYLSVQQEHAGLPPARQHEPQAREHVPLHELRSHRDAPPERSRTEPRESPSETSVDDGDDERDEQTE
jgi:small subunit ribosomal protein S6